MQYVDRKNQLLRPAITGVILLLSALTANVPAPTWAAAVTGPAGAAAPSATTSAPAPTRGVEGLIAHLHEKFQITPTQENAFQKVAEVMRENADTMSALAKKRAEGAKASTAVDDLKSYSEISEAHSLGTKKMIPVFKALYDSMSASQKLAADDEFREHYTAHHHRM